MFVDFFAKKIQIENHKVLLWLYPLIVVILTLVISICIIYIINIIKSKKVIK